ncbi:MAG: hypothetical protein KDA37_02850, partial [Planctomycetales bacterium]|nr:hypothetical protein [Planctomycetales bacterium]
MLLLSTIAAAVLAAGGCSCGPGGCMQPAHNAPPAAQLMHPGPGVGGPGPGVIPVGNQMLMGPGGPPPGCNIGPGGNSMCCGGGYCDNGPVNPGGMMQCQYCEGGACGPGGCLGDGGMGGTSQIAFVGEEGLQVQWDVSGSGM